MPSRGCGDGFSLPDLRCVSAAFGGGRLTARKTRRRGGGGREVPRSSPPTALMESGNNCDLEGQVGASIVVSMSPLIPCDSGPPVHHGTLLCRYGGQQPRRQSFRMDRRHCACFRCCPARRHQSGLRCVCRKRPSRQPPNGPRHTNADKGSTAQGSQMLTLNSCCRHRNRHSAPVTDSSRSTISAPFSRATLRFPSSVSPAWLTIFLLGVVLSKNVAKNNSIASTAAWHRHSSRRVAFEVGVFRNGKR